MSFSFYVERSAKPDSGALCSFSGVNRGVRQEQRFGVFEGIQASVVDEEHLRLAHAFGRSDPAMWHYHWLTKIMAITTTYAVVNTVYILKYVVYFEVCIYEVTAARLGCSDKGRLL